jgi:hypothetical protein
MKQNDFYTTLRIRIYISTESKQYRLAYLYIHNLTYLNTIKCESTQSDLLKNI